MSLVKVDLKLNTAELQRANSRIAGLSGKCAAYLANKACYYIAKHAQAIMPVVTVGEIASDMSAVGFARNSKDKDWRKTNKERRDLTAAERIVLASIHPNSRFNIRTGGVFRRQAPIFSSPSPGGGGRLTRVRGYKLGAQNRLRFWAWIEAQAIRMVAARKSSGGFYKLGATVIKVIFDKFAPPVQRPPSESGLASTAEATPYGKGASSAIGRVAGGTRATATGNRAAASFWVSTTEPDSKGAGEGFTKVLQPVWNRAVEIETGNAVAYGEKLFAQALREAGYEVR
jgi:hypothetical protein